MTESTAPKQSIKDKLQNAKRSITWKVVGKMVMIMILVNAIVISCIAYWVNYIIVDGEKKYMSEVISRLSEQVDHNIEKYMDGPIGLSQNIIVKDFLTNTRNVGNYPAPDNDNYNTVLQELSILSQMYGDVILNVTIGSVESNNIIDHTGRHGGSNYLLSDTAFYSAITNNSVVVSDSYPEFQTGLTIFTIAAPVHSDTGEIVGLVGLDIDVEKISSFVTGTTFGATGTTFIIDKNDTMLVHPNSTLVGTTLTDGYFSGDSLLGELANPTGAIFEYDSNGIERLGGVAVINSSGWKLISAINVSEFQERSNSVITLLTALQVVCMMAIILICAFDFHKKLSPMKQIQQFMGEVAKGNLHTDLDFTSEDEMGDLVQDIRKTLKVLNTYVSHISSTMEDFGKGNFVLDYNVEYNGDFLPIFQSMEQFVSLISDSLRELKQSVREVDAGATQLAGGAQSLAVGATEQAASVEALKTLIASVNAEILETAKYSSRISGYAENISHDIAENDTKMQQLAVSVTEIKDLSDEVKRIIKAIEEVAFQTNILALNAAVEAARAGPSGRGFAVVADEVRALSMKTAEAVDDTTQIITNMATFIEASTDLAQETSSGLHRIVDEAQGFVSNMAKISHSTQDQSDTMSEIHEGIEHISNVVSQNSAVSEESAAASQQLSAQSTGMMHLIKKFQLKPKEGQGRKKSIGFKNHD